MTISPKRKWVGEGFQNFPRIFLHQGTSSGSIISKIGAGAAITPYPAIPFGKKRKKNSLYRPVVSVHWDRNGWNPQKAHPAYLPDLCKKKFQVASLIRVTFTGEQFIENIEKMFFFGPVMGWVGSGESRSPKVTPGAPTSTTYQVSTL